MSHYLVVNRHHPGAKWDVYVGRPSKWGNKYSHVEAKGTIRVRDRETAVRMFREELWQRILHETGFIEELAKLDGKILSCWCAPLPCHADVLAAAARWAALTSFEHRTSGSDIETSDACSLRTSSA